MNTPSVSTDEFPKPYTSLAAFTAAHNDLYKRFNHHREGNNHEILAEVPADVARSLFRSRAS